MRVKKARSQEKPAYCDSMSAHLHLLSSRKSASRNVVRKLGTHGNDTPLHYFHFGREEKGS